MGAVAATGAAAAAFLYGDRLRWFYPLLAALNVAIAALSGSRMAFAVTIGVTGFVLLAQRREFLFKFVVVVYGSAALAAFVAIFSDQIIARLMSRTLSGREIIWSELRGYIERYPKLGIGLGHQMDVMSANATVMTHTIAAHNEYLRFILELGYFGAAAFAALFATMLITLLRSPRMRQPWCFAAVSGAFLVFSATDNTFSVPFCFLLLVGAMMGASAPQDTTDPVAATVATWSPEGAPLSRALVRSP
jgi:O-antigen ligase